MGGSAITGRTGAHPGLTTSAAIPSTNTRHMDSMMRVDIEPQVCAELWHFVKTLDTFATSDPLWRMSEAYRIRPTVETKKMLTELRERWPLMRPHMINRYALEQGLSQVMSMPTLLPPELAAAFRKGMP